ncbi:MAG: HlyD family efflux transporter periplasmic adaptor subunit [Planctomycetaceae bacterium]|nr:HlyD family efflux transporter periplasmic adaptor subunit [Planctomycetaceae bacterium]
MSAQVEEKSPAPSGAAAGQRPGAASPLSEKVRSLRISQTPARKGSGSMIPWLLCLALAVSTGYFAYLSSEPNRESGETALGSLVPKLADSSPGAQPVAVAGSGGVVLESKGYIVPTHKILLSPKVNGMVKYLRIQDPDKPPEEGIALEEGMRVKKGDILAVLESTDYEADVARSLAMLASSEFKLEMERKNLPNEIERAQSELSEAVTNQNYLKTVVGRNEKLAKTVAVSPTEVEKAQSEFDSAVHRVQRLQSALELIKGPRAERIKVAEADVSQARAEVTKSEWRLGNCLIVAPVSGTILKKTVEEGNIVNPAAFNGSFSVCEMADLGDLEVDLSIQERDVSKVFVGQRCVVRAEAFPDRAYDGRVSRLMPIADRAKGAIPVRVKVRIPPAEEGVYLKPEMGAVVSFYGHESPPAEEPTSGGG